MARELRADVRIERMATKIKMMKLLKPVSTKKPGQQQYNNWMMF